MPQVESQSLFRRHHETDSISCHPQGSMSYHPQDSISCHQRDSHSVGVSAHDMLLDKHFKAMVRYSHTEEWQHQRSFTEHNSIPEQSLREQCSHPSSTTLHFPNNTNVANSPRLIASAANASGMTPSTASGSTWVQVPSHLETRVQELTGHTARRPNSLSFGNSSTNSCLSQLLGGLCVPPIIGGDDVNQLLGSLFAIQPVASSTINVKDCIDVPELVSLVKYQCGYCSRVKDSVSTASDGRTRIRCECGGKYRDNRPRMHAMWKLLETTEDNPAPMPLRKLRRKNQPSTNETKPYKR